MENKQTFEHLKKRRTLIEHKQNIVRGPIEHLYAKYMLQNCLQNALFYQIRVSDLFA